MSLVDKRRSHVSGVVNHRGIVLGRIIGRHAASAIARQDGCSGTVSRSSFLDLACYHDGSETDAVGRTTKQKSGAGRWVFGAAHVVCGLVHRLVVGRIGGMPKPQEGNFPV